MFFNKARDFSIYHRLTQLRSVFVFVAGHFEFIRGCKGNRLIKMDGYTYCTHIVRESSHGPKMRWRCSTNNSKGCKAAFYTIDDVVICGNTVHNHAPDYARNNFKNI